MKLYFLLFLYCNASIYANYVDCTQKVTLPNYETITAFFNSNTQTPLHDKLIQDIAGQELSKKEILPIFNKYHKSSIESNGLKVDSLLELAKFIKENPSRELPSSSIPRFLEQDKPPLTDITEEWEII